MITNSLTVFPPGPSANESRKLLIALRRDTLRFWLDLHDHYGDFVYASLAGNGLYALRDPQLIREVLADKNAVMRRTDYTWDTLGRFLGEGLVVSHGDTHKRRRGIIQSLFTPRWVEGYFPTILDCVIDLISRWQSGTVRDMVSEMHHLALNIIYRTIFGGDTGAIETDLTHAIAVIQTASAQRMQTGSIRLDEREIAGTLDVLNRIIDELIAQRRSSRETDLLSLLVGRVLIGNGELTDKEIREEIITFFLAGQETTANALAWVWYLLGQHPDVLRGLRHEIDSVTNGNPLEFAHIAQMRYLEAVIKETLRLYPPAWIIGRCATEPVEIGSYQIQPDVPINICIFALHRNPKVFAEPQSFQPERFAQEPPRYGYLPFGGGPHVCVGQPLAMLEMSVALASILQQWEFKLLNVQEIVAEPMMTLRPGSAINAELIRR